MRLRGTVVEVGQLASADRDAMFRLMDRIYVNMRRDRFEDDLNAKQWAIIVRSPTSGDIVGFSTQVVLTVPIDGETVDALYSGDTVVDREHWGDPALASAWGNFALQLVDGRPMRRMVWFLTSKGFRTYRYLPLFFRTYFPHPARAIPARERKIIEHLGRFIGGDFTAHTREFHASCTSSHPCPARGTQRSLRICSLTCVTQLGWRRAYVRQVPSSRMPDESEKYS
jgi:hypothetical protein